MARTGYISCILGVKVARRAGEVARRAGEVARRAGIGYDHRNNVNFFCERCGQFLISGYQFLPQMNSFLKSFFLYRTFPTWAIFDI
jgi:hypothetical protein